MKKYKTIWIFGSLTCLSGEIVRKVAILTAKKSFHHIVSLWSPRRVQVLQIFLLTDFLLEGPISAK